MNKLAIVVDEGYRLGDAVQAPTMRRCERCGITISDARAPLNKWLHALCHNVHSIICIRTILCKTTYENMKQQETARRARRGLPKTSKRSGAAQFAAERARFEQAQYFSVLLRVIFCPIGKQRQATCTRAVQGTLQLKRLMAC